MSRGEGAVRGASHLPGAAYTAPGGWRGQMYGDELRATIRVTGGRILGGEWRIHSTLADDEADLFDVWLEPARDDQAAADALASRLRALSEDSDKLVDLVCLFDTARIARRGSASDELAVLRAVLEMLR